MFYLYDVDGYKGDFGSSLVVADFVKIVKQLDMPATNDLFETGYTTAVDELINEFEEIDISDFSFGELEDIVVSILEILEKSKEIVILTDGSE